MQSSFVDKPARSVVISMVKARLLLSMLISLVIFALITRGLARCGFECIESQAFPDALCIMVPLLEMGGRGIDMRKSKKELRLVLSYPVVWALSIAYFWLFTSGSDGAGYALVFVWLLNPAAILAVSLLIGWKQAWGRRVWAAPVILGGMYMLLPYATFTLANTLSFGSIHAPDAEMALFGALTSTLGLCLGRLFGWLRRRSLDAGEAKL